MARILRHIAVEVGKINFPILQVSNLYEFPDKGGEKKIIEFHNQSVGTPIGVVGFAHAGGVMARNSSGTLVVISEGSALRKR